MLNRMTLLPSILAIVLVSVTVVGCVQFGETPDGYENDDDCKFCHARGNANGVKDFSNIYNNEAAHHPVDIKFPISEKFGDDFNMPNGRKGDMAFFDRDGDKKLGADEIRLFWDDGIAEVTCASCHREHSKSHVAVEHPDDDYLRGTNVDGELCLTCHRKQVKPMLHQ
jgi:hypothetical protein